MAKKVLVAYATGAGSTAEVAAEVGRVIQRAEDVSVHVQSVRAVRGIQEYDAVIIGTAIRAGKPLPATSEFVKTNREALSKRPVAYFVVCLTMKEENEKTCQEVEAYLDPLKKMVPPVTVGLFAGVMEYAKLPLVLRLIVRAMKAPEGDFRDWQAIRAWAEEARGRLLPSA
jgi:menaquinone-dependent protoporphyrinogen oxidase